jgi:hypothetical protein
MNKRALNLEILESEQLDNKRAAVSLMPCPCGASGGGPCGLVSFGVGYIVSRGIDNVIEGNVAPPPYGGSMSPTGGECGTDADFGGINADIDGNPDAC